MAKSIPAGWRIRVMLPVRGRLQQYELHSPVAFRCSQCRRDTSTRTVATLDWDWSTLVCEGCHGKLSAAKHGEPAGPIVLEPWKPSVPEPRKAPVMGKAVPAASARIPQQKREGWRGTPQALRRNLKQLAVILRERAAGSALNFDEQRALKALADDPVLPVALRYAEALVEGEAMAGNRGRGVPSYGRTLTQQRIAAVRQWENRYYARLTHARRMTVVPERLSVLVLRTIVGEKYDRALSAVLRQRGLRPDALNAPAARLWSWLVKADSDQAYGVSALPQAVRQLLNMHDKAFAQVVMADAAGTRPEAALEHPALVERWAAGVGEVELRLRSVRNQCAKSLAKPVKKGERGNGFRKLEAAVRAYALASARAQKADFLLKELRLQVELTYRQEKFQRFRIARLEEAAEAIYRADPALAAEVKRASAEHRATCSRWSARDPCVSCAPQVVALVRERLSLSGKASKSTEEATEPTVLNGAAPDAEDATCAGDWNSFICSDLRRQVPARAGRLVGVTEVRYDAGSGRFGFAWVTEHGELRTGTDRAINGHDASVQAACHTALDLGGGLSSVQVICRDERAASVVNHVVSTRYVPDELGFPVTERTRKLLKALTGCRGKVVASVNTCIGSHRGPVRAEHLAVLVLGAGSKQGGAEKVKAAADRISNELRDLAQSPEPESSEKIGQARWMPGGFDAGELRWRAALRRVHLVGGWTVLPDGLQSPVADRQPLRLVVDHPSRKLAPVRTESEVLLRRVGGQWELHGIDWPRGMLPGTLVTYRWRPGEKLIRAGSELLPHPSRIDELTYRHRYDIQVVTRENVPGADQEGTRPDLSDAGWVMRTLRTLGHLSADGSAVLAEAALVRNCLELGLPEDRTERIHATVEQLIRERRIRRVAGSLDRTGQPSYPPRRGESRVDLLRYAPRVEHVAPPPDHRGVEQPNRRDHWVSGFVRRLPPGAHASDEQMDAHREAVRAAEVVDRPLPDGYTYVRRHRRGR